MLTPTPNKKKKSTFKGIKAFIGSTLFKSKKKDSIVLTEDQTRGRVVQSLAKVNLKM